MDLKKKKDEPTNRFCKNVTNVAVEMQRVDTITILKCFMLNNPQL